MLQNPKNFRRLRRRFNQKQWFLYLLQGFTKFGIKLQGNWPHQPPSLTPPPLKQETDKLKGDEGLQNRFSVIMEMDCRSDYTCVHILRTNFHVSFMVCISNQCVTVSMLHVQFFSVYRIYMKKTTNLVSGGYETGRGVFIINTNPYPASAVIVKQSGVQFQSLLKYGSVERSGVVQ